MAIAKAMLAVSALVTIFYGAWQVYPPAAYIVVGGLLWYEMGRGK
jgi:hypothetical protein